MSDGLPPGIAGPLDGLTVLDLTHFQSGPFASMMLGDMGADVIKVEPPRGDPMRRLGTTFVGGEGTFFLSVNRNKRGIAIDLKQEAGREIIRTLAGRCDVFMHNFRVGVAERLELDYAHVRELNPQVIYCAITAYGESGPKASLPSVDPIVQAMSGLMSITGEPDGPPTMVGPAISDTAGSIVGVRGILLALLARERFGVGQEVNVSMLDSTISLLTGREGVYLATGAVPARAGSLIPHASPSGMFPTSDGLVMVAAINEGFWQRLCAAIEMPELADDPRFATNELRVRDRQTLDTILAGITKQRPTDHWVAAFARHGVIGGPVNDLKAALDDEQVRHNGMVVAVDHPTAGEIRSLGIPVQLGKTPGTIRRPPPLLGQHTREVLMQAGISEDRCEELASEGVTLEASL